MTAVRRAGWAVVVLFAAVPACQLGLDPSRLDAGSVDAASVDAASVDAGDAGDAGSIDGGRDGGVDAGDAQVATETDGGLDGGRDSGSDAGSDAGDAGPPVCPDIAPTASIGLSDVARPPLDNGPSFARPDRGAWFPDPTFDTCLTRISDARPTGEDFDEPGAIGAIGRTLLTTRGGYEYYRFDLDAPSSAALRGPLFSSNAPGFLAGSDDDVHYLGQDPGEYFGVHRMTLSTRATVTGRIFEAELLAAFPTANRLLATNRSPYSDVGTGVYLALHDNDTLGLVTIDHATGTMLGHLSTASMPVRMVAMTPSGRVVVATWTHADVYDATFAESTRRRVGFEDYAYELDTAVLPGGHDALVWATLTELRAIDLGTAGSTSQTLLSWPRPSGTSSLWVRISGAARAKPGWVVVAFGGCAACAPASHPGNGRISVVEIDGGATVYDVAWHRSERLGNGEYGSVFALPSRDLTRIVFNTTWGEPAGDSEDDLFLIEIPASAIPAADAL